MRLLGPVALTLLAALSAGLAASCAVRSDPDPKNRPPAASSEREARWPWGDRRRTGDPPPWVAGSAAPHAANTGPAGSSTAAPPKPAWTAPVAVLPGPVPTGFRPPPAGQILQPSAESRWVFDRGWHAMNLSGIRPPPVRTMDDAQYLLRQSPKRLAISPATIEELCALTPLKKRGPVELAINLDIGLDDRGLGCVKEIAPQVAYLPRIDVITYGKLIKENPQLVGFGVIDQYQITVIPKRARIVACGFSREVRKLSFFSNAEQLFIPGESFSLEQWQELAGLTHLKSLNLTEARVTDFEAVHLSALTGLRHLNLSGTDLTAAGLGRLRRMSKIESLDLNQLNLTSAFLEVVSKMKTLKRLSLRDTQLDNAALAQTAALWDLHAIDLEGATGITGDGLAPLATLRNLRHINASRTGLEAASYGQLGTMKQLETLQLRGMTNSAVANVFSALAKIPTLTVVDLSDNPQLRGADTTEIAKWRELRELNLGGTGIGDAQVANLAPLRKLAILNLRKSSITNLGIARLAGLSELRELNLESARIDNGGLRSLSRFAQLRVLSLKSTQITDLGVPDLERLSSLLNLNVARTRITPEGRKRLQLGLPNTLLDF